MCTSSPGVFAAGNMLHGVETSGWCAREGRHAGEMIARFLRTEITGVQGGARFVLSGEIAYLVPQRWDAAVAVAPVAPTLRLNRDLGSGSVRLQCGSDEVWMGSPGPLLRRRRIRLALDALSPAAPGSQQLAVSVR